VTDSASGASLSVELLQQIIDAAREDAPNETVGLLAAPTYANNGGSPTRFVRLRNDAASPHRFALQPAEQVPTLLEMEEAGEVLWGIVHSHVGSAPIPSASDVELAHYPDSLHVICSLANPVPEVRAWAIREGDVSEVALSVG
jgi:[CysO sulfur-carrier protein]-S-L-cysteine hydrolase